MKKRHICLLILLCTGWLFLTGFQKAESEFSMKPEHLKSVTYCSDEWVVNFWNSESSDMEEELKQISADGFNSIILVIPWREFQPGVSFRTYNNYAFDKLNRVMEAAKNQGLWVVLRVGYTWDYAGKGNHLIRYQELMYKETVKEAWMDYVEAIYKNVSGYPNFYGGFLTWEDFWNFVDTAGTMGRGVDSVKMAETIGYSKYAREHYTEAELEAFYGSQLLMGKQLYLPDRKQPAFKIFYEFYDDFLNRLLEDTQQVFPDISMEVRLDVDPVPTSDGGVVGAAHTKTYPCANSSFTSLMYSVAMGQKNQGERIHAANAVAKASEILDGVKRDNLGKPLYIDQFLYMDGTPGYEHNAQLYEEQRSEFIVGMAPVMRSKTIGYGIWTYRNYADNMLYNSQFGLNEEGWEFLDSKVVTRNNTKQAKLFSAKSQISQRISDREPGEKRANTNVRFHVDSEKPRTLTVLLGDAKKVVNVSGEKVWDLTFVGNEAKEITFSSDGELFLDNIKVYTYEQDGQIYDMDGMPLECLEAIRILNETL